MVLPSLQAILRADTRINMTVHSKRFLAFLVLFLSSVLLNAPAQSSPAQPTGPDLNFPTVLYGAAYYNEYMPGDQNARLEKDVALMKAAGLNVVRMGESTWSLWEPEDGHFDYAWMDRIVDAMGKAGIKVILGTPTYSIPAWMAHQHPEILADRIPPGMFGGKAQPAVYGLRQNMDTDSPAYRFYAERLIRHIVAHYKDNPTVIGWQLDNETSSYDAANPDVFIGFQHYLEKKFVTPEALSKAWFLNYWGENLHTWEDLPKRDGTISTGYKLEWTRWSQMRVTDFLHWQAELVRECAGPRQFVTTDYGGMMKRDVNEEAVAEVARHCRRQHLPRHAGPLRRLVPVASERFLPFAQARQFPGDGNQRADHRLDFGGQFPPYDGQLREDVYTYLANGANMVEYWHWASIAANQETYWKGILSHDLEPNREYAEMTRTAHELEKDRPAARRPARFTTMSPFSGAAIRRTPSALCPMAAVYPRAAGPAKPDGYASLRAAVAPLALRPERRRGFCLSRDAGFLAYKLLIVPALYISDDALLQRISDYVKNGGHVVMTFKSGFANENSAVRWVRAPGPLREAAGFSYQEFSSLEHPLALKGDPFHVGDANKVQYWAEFLMPEHAKALAYYDHPFFGKWPAITENNFGTGTLLYEGTYLSDELQAAIMKHAIEEAGLTSSDQQLPAAVHVQSGINRMGKRLHYYFNYSAAPVHATYAYGAGADLLDGKAVSHDEELTLEPWDLAIVEEN